MEFIQILLQNSNLKEAKLYSAAQKAATNPEIGITVQNKAAYHVIKDCAAITMHYLPHLVFGSYLNPFESLKGKFSKECIAEFVKLAETTVSLNQLMYVIISKAQKMNVLTVEQREELPDIKLDVRDVSMDDPYGDYGIVDSHIKPQKSITTITMTPFEQLCKVFGCK
jgi:hypothetical protein